MAQGNNSKREGAKSHELYVLQALNRIVDAIAGAGLPPSPTGIATEQTLSDFATANNDDLQAILTALQTGLASAANQQTLISAFNAFANQNNIDIVDVKDAIETFDSQNGADLTALLTELQTFATQNNTDLGTVVSQLQGLAASNLTGLQNVETAIQTFDAQNGTDLAAILTALQNGDQLANIRSNTAKDGSGTALYPLLDTDGHLQVDILSGGGGGTTNSVDTNNSTTTPLGAGAVFTGTGTDVSTYNSVTIQLFADVDSAAEGMSFQFSPDGTNWDEQNDYNLEVSVSQTRRFQFPVTAQYFRVVYTNGGSAQTAFRVQTILHTSDVLTSIHRLDTGLTNDRSVTVTKSVIAGETSAGGGAFVNVKVAPSGSLETNANQDTHDALNANANIQVGDVDVSGANPVPTTMASTTVIPNLVRSTGAGTIPLGARSFSIANVGAADADILGGINNLKAGEVVNFDAGLNNTYGLVVYDATGTELLITYNS